MISDAALPASSGAHPDLAGGRLTIDLGAICANWRMCRDHALRDNPAGETGAVVKANAYGCGIEPVVAALAAAGCRTFFVALVEEGRRVKAVAPDATCFVLNGLFDHAVPHMLEAGLIPVLGSLREIELWASAAQAAPLRPPLPCALQVDSGMTRLGLSLVELQQVMQSRQFQALDVQLLMTHFACADDIGHAKTEAQKFAFEQARALLPNLRCSAANSAATLQASGYAYDLARPGVALYGGEALNNVPNPASPVVTLEARIISVRDAKAGDAVGYGACDVLERDSRIAHVSVGYADGYHRAASHAGVPMRQVAQAAKGAFNGSPVQGIGRISMDMCAFDVTDVDAQAGDWIELFGPTIAVDDVARAGGTIGYEYLTGLGSRFARTYLNDNG